MHRCWQRVVLGEDHRPQCLRRATSRKLDPASAKDFAFDSDEAGSADDLYESNAMERSIRLPAGLYRFRVERAVTALTASPVASRLDDWHFAVEASA